MFEFIGRVFFHSKQRIEDTNKSRRVQHELVDELAESYAYMLVEGIASDLMF